MPAVSALILATSAVFKTAGYVDFDVVMACAGLIHRWTIPAPTIAPIVQ